MKMLIATALVVTALPGAALAGDASENSARERRVCTQFSVRAGSRMSGRRICRSPTEWREALGADWRQRLAGYQGLEAEHDLLQQRTSGNNDYGGVQPVAGGFGAGRAAGPR